MIRTNRTQTLLFRRAIGIGAVQANMAVFGAEQVREHNSTATYFDKYYTVVNAGGLVAFGFIAYVQQNNSYFVGYIVSTVLLICALLSFLVGYRLYMHIRVNNSLMNHLLPVVINAFQTWRKHCRHVKRLSRSTSEEVEYRLKYDDRLSSMNNEQTWSFLDYAKLSNQGQFIDRIVDDVKSLRRIIIVFLLLTPYWLVYFQVRITSQRHRRISSIDRSISSRWKQRLSYKAFICE
jgi:hypothetical protein